MAETPGKEPQVETPNEEMQLDKQAVALNRRSSRMSAIVVFSFALAVIGMAATYALPRFNIALPNFGSFAELFQRETAPIPDPAVSAALKDIRSAQQQNAVALLESGAALQLNTTMLQQGAANLESLKQGITAQHANLKTISNQLSTLIARVDSLQDAVTPLTTSSIPQPNARARSVGTSRKKITRLPKPVGPVSVGGAPLSPAPAPGSVFGG